VLDRGKPALHAAGAAGVELKIGSPFAFSPAFFTAAFFTFRTFMAWAFWRRSAPPRKSHCTASPSARRRTDSTSGPAAWARMVSTSGAN